MNPEMNSDLSLRFKLLVLCLGVWRVQHDEQKAPSEAQQHRGTDWKEGLDEANPRAAQELRGAHVQYALAVSVMCHTKCYFITKSDFFF